MMSQLFSRELKDLMGQKLKEYLKEELDCEVGNFEAEFLIDFISENFGPLYYNQALRDGQLHLSAAIDSLSERIAELERPLTIQV